MKQNEIKIGEMYVAKVNGNLTKVRVNGRVYAKTIYDVTNIETGRSTTFRSPTKFRAPVKG